MASPKLTGTQEASPATEISSAFQLVMGTGRKKLADIKVPSETLPLNEPSASSSSRDHSGSAKRSPCMEAPEVVILSPTKMLEEKI